MVISPTSQARLKGWKLDISLPLNVSEIWNAQHPQVSREITGKQQVL